LSSIFASIDGSVPEKAAQWQDKTGANRSSNALSRTLTLTICQNLHTDRRFAAQNEKQI
jgi:hypothetical protein